MEIAELHALGNDLLDRVRGRVDEPNWNSASSLLYHGEEEEFADLLLAMLADGAVVLSEDEFEKVTRLVAAFPVADYEPGLHRYLTDPRVLQRMTVTSRS